MRQIGEIKDPDQARRFVAFLLTKGIRAQAEQEEGLWEIWAKDEDQVELATEELNQFLANPSAEQYRGAIQKAGELERERQRQRREIQKNIVKVSDRGVGQQRSPLTTLLIVISAIVFLLTNFGEPTNRSESTFRSLAFLGVQGPQTVKILEAADNDLDAPSVRLASIGKFEIWRLITPIFLHFGVFHILFNMIWLYQLGRVIEFRYGTFWYGLLVLAVAAGSNFAQGVVPGELGGSVPFSNGNFLIAPFGGMSGVVYGLFGFIWMKSTYDRSSGFRIPGSTVIFLLGYLFFCMTPFSEQLLGTAVANWCHGIGLVVGMVAGLLPGWSRKARV